MLTTYGPPQYQTITERYLVFDDARGSGCWFPCDEAGRLLPSVQLAAVRTYECAMAHPEKYERWNRIVEQERTYREPAFGVCECGAEFELYNQYLGGCACPGCGRWYNLFGQELNPPSTWPDGDDW